jgi:hypothetical protein
VWRVDDFNRLFFSQKRQFGHWRLLRSLQKRYYLMNLVKIDWLNFTALILLVHNDEMFYCEVCVIISPKRKSQTNSLYCIKEINWYLCYRHCIKEWSPVCNTHFLNAFMHILLLLLLLETQCINLESILLFCYIFLISKTAKQELRCRAHIFFGVVYEK